MAKETAALILVPNRELALQIFDVANHFGEALNIRIRVLLGGKKSKYYAKKVADEGFFHSIFYALLIFIRSMALSTLYSTVL